MTATIRLTAGDLIALLAETDEELAFWRLQLGHPYRQHYVDAYLARRFILAKKLAARTSRPQAVPA